jgi:hypothetical protein
MKPREVGSMRPPRGVPGIALLSLVLGIAPLTCADPGDPRSSPVVPAVARTSPPSVEPPWGLAEQAMPNDIVRVIQILRALPPGSAGPIRYDPMLGRFREVALVTEQGAASLVAMPWDLVRAFPGDPGVGAFLEMLADERGTTVVVSSEDSDETQWALLKDAADRSLLAVGRRGGEWVFVLAARTASGVEGAATLLERAIDEAAVTDEAPELETWEELSDALGEAGYEDCRREEAPAPGVERYTCDVGRFAGAEVLMGDDHVLAGYIQLASALGVGGCSIFQTATGWLVTTHYADDDRVPAAAIDDAEALGSDLHGCIPELGF